MQRFLAAVQIVFQLYFIALSWPTAVWLGENDITNYEQFIKLFQHVFHSPDGKEVSDKLLSLRQGNHHAAEYFLDFRTLAAESRWNDSALRAVYIQGLNKKLIKELAFREEASSLDKLINISISWITSRKRLRTKPKKHQKPCLCLDPSCRTLTFLTPPQNGDQFLPDQPTRKISRWQQKLCF